MEKRYRRRVRDPGLSGLVRSLLRPRHEEVPALGGVDLSLKTGESLALIGPNGAGKSTTIKILTGILFPTKGEVKVLGLIIVSFTVMAHSLAFWLGDADGLAAELWGALISFSTYPTVIFKGAVKVMLFTVLPAGFIAYVPVELLRQFRWPWMAGLLGFTALIVLASTAMFRAGLRRYESGNLLAGRQ